MAEQPAFGLDLRPTRQLLGAAIQVVDATGNIGGDNGIPDGRQSDLDPFLLVDQGVLGTPTFRNLLLQIRDRPVQLGRPFLYAALELPLACPQPAPPCG